ncbi:MAG: signal recognition particle-docking protein FtsY [Pseudomonadota bacterium]|nr:signal recognition particle-docking protein FtsY [Pseudomonadota bacterium]
MAFSFKQSKDPASGGTENEPRAAPETDSGKRGLFSRLKRGLSKTNAILNEDIGTLIKGKIDESLLEEIETRLLMADVGVEATTEIIDDLQSRLRRNQMKDAAALFDALGEHMREILAPCNEPLSIPQDLRPYILLVVGVNGVGKTTTIGKIARRLRDEGLSVMLAAGDTFRAAAVEQLQAWGERNGVPVVAQETGADSASVIFDAMESARARNIDVLIADTAGRLHTQTNLMDELSKVERVIRKLDPGAPHEVMLVLDAGTGQNALNQARQFNAAVGVTGISVTKLDGTAKGGILFALARKTGIPIRFIGVGESVEDLRVFDAAEFVNALLQRDAG